MNHYEKTLTLTLLSICFTINAQQETWDTEKVWRLNFLLPGAELELPVSSQTTFSINPKFGFAFAFSGGSNQDDVFEYAVLPMLDLKYRWYYNFDKRTSKNLNISNNSANFLALRTVSRFPALASEGLSDYEAFSQELSMLWGLQRAYGSFNLIFGVGPGVIQRSNGDTDLTLALDFSLGFNL